VRCSAPRGAVRLCVPGGPWSRSVHLNALGLHGSVHALGPAHPVGPGAARARAAAFAAAAAAAVKARGSCTQVCVCRGGLMLRDVLNCENRSSSSMIIDAPVLGSAWVLLAGLATHVWV